MVRCFVCSIMCPEMREMTPCILHAYLFIAFFISSSLVARSTERVLWILPYTSSLRFLNWAWFGRGCVVKLKRGYSEHIPPLLGMAKLLDLPCSSKHAGESYSLSFIPFSIEHPIQDLAICFVNFFAPVGPKICGGHIDGVMPKCCGNDVSGDVKLCLRDCSPGCPS